MVRRWSRINEFNFFFKNKKLFFFKKSSKYKMFKLTVSTRKFYKKYTKFRRKAFNRLRHKTNWLVYSNLFKFWSYDYLTTKTISKKFWLLNSQQFNFTAFNWSSAKNTNPELFFNFNYHMLNLNSLFFKQRTDSSNFNNFFFWKNFKNISIALTETFNSIDLEAASSLLLYDNLLYEIPNDLSSSLNSDFLLFFKINSEYSLQYLMSTYKIIIYLTLLDL